MRHNKVGRQLGRNSSHRKAMFRNMVTSLFMHGKIRTTDAKAKEVRKIAEKLITLGKRGDLHARRRALSYVRSVEAVAKLFGEIAEAVAARPGGYTRIIKIGARKGDNAPISLLEIVTEPCAPKAKKAAPKAPKAPVVEPVAAAPVVEEAAPVVE
ncbi:50S ribosomal protein L17, partial [bacterium]